ncbi:hypothetical protein HK102_010020 [Quaeritorhiza haematococci]|nr:hypothetical protein HK102_010020 [Quaeritorhiza haematococci]
MAQPRLVSLEHPELPPYPLSPRLRSRLVYFQSGPAAPAHPAPRGEGEYWFDRDEVTKWVMEGVFYLVSPLDTEKATEVELTEEQDSLLVWLETHKVRHARVEE